MAPGRALPEPQTVIEAEQYVGREIWKFFKETQRYYQGKVEGVDTAVETESGEEEQGIFFRMHYPADDDREHILWPELAQLLLKAEKGKRKSSDKQAHAPAAEAPKGRHAAAAAGAAAAVEEQAPSNKRRRRSAAEQQQQRQHVDEDMLDASDEAEAAADAASSDYEADEAPAAGSKRGRQQQAQAGNSTARRKPQGRRQQHRNDVTPDLDDAAAAEDKEDREEAEDQEEGEDDDDQQQLSAEELERILQEGSNEVVTVRTKGLAGHLKSIQVQNFMCHRNFAMDFGTHVNVVSGSNGSGKSAVLQALQCALGVKARDTGRSQKIGQLVRTGCHDAKLQVTLWNTGEDAYKHEVYGDWITVEQTIKVSGGAKETASSKWRLLDCHGRKVSESKQELGNMLDHLNINAGNPLAVMTQDTSRNFLCGSVADKKKYQLFMQATMLEDMQRNLMLAQGYVEAMMAAIVEIHQMHTARASRVSEVKEKLQKLEESAGLAEQRTMFERATHWAAVEQAEAKVKEIRHNLEVVGPERRAQRQSVIEEMNRDLDMLREREETLTADADKINRTQDAFSAEMRQLGEELKRARLEHRHRAKTFKDLQHKLASLQAELNSLLDAKKESSDDRQREFAERLAAHQSQMQQAQAEMEAAHTQHQQQEAELQKLHADKAAKEQEVRDLQSRQQQASGTLNNLQAELQRLQKAKGQKLALFGQQHVLLRNLVDRNARMFDQVPIGPIGAHLTLRSGMWAVASEVVLGPHLEKWIVHSNRDSQTLKGLVRNLKISTPQILVANFNRPAYNIPPRRLAAGWHCMRDFVVVNHPQLAHIIDNKLMDMAFYDRGVVHDDESSCMDAVYRGAAGPAVTSVVHVSGKHWNKARRNNWLAQNYWKDRQPRLGESFEATLQGLQELLRVQQASYQTQQQQLVAAHAELQQLQRQAEALNKASRSSMTMRMRATHKIQTLQSTMPVLEAGDDDGDDGDMLAEQQRTLQEQLAATQQAFDRAKAELEQATLKQEQTRQLQEARQSELEDTLSQMNSRAEELEQVAAERVKLTALRDRHQADINSLDAQLQQLQQQNELAKKAKEDYKEKALKACSEADGHAALAAARASIRSYLEERIRKRGPMEQQEMDATLHNIMQEQCHKKGPVTFNKRAEDLTKRIASVERDAGGNEADLRHQLDKAELEFRRHDASVSNMSKIVRMTRAQVRARWTAYEKLFDDVSTTVSQKFMAYMYRRGHQGKVRVYQDAGELRLLVKINTGAGEEAKKSKAVRDLKQLSGGERSFTTVAFILALGEFTESPFRAMDEFDVFMDAINRRIATQTLLEFAREKGHLQFVFLTPQDLQAVEDAKRKLAEDRNGKPLPDGFVKVVQMQPARPQQ